MAAWWRIRDDPDPYVYRILVNTHVSWTRRLWRREIPVPRTPDVSRVGDEDGLAHRAAVWDALRALPPRQRAVLVLRYYEDLTEPQAARFWGAVSGR